MTYYIRVIFRTFPTEKELIAIQQTHPVLVKKIRQVKSFCIPENYKGLEYDHVELITWDRRRISIRIGPEGVYCNQIDGLHKAYVDEMRRLRYKLVFVFKIDEKQKLWLEKFIEQHTGDPYSEGVLYFNCAMKRYCSSLTCIRDALMFDDWNFRHPPKTKRWDCVTLILRIMRSLNLLPEKYLGSKINILGLTSLDMALVLLFLYKNNALRNLEYVISKEFMEEEEWEEAIKKFHLYGTKQIKPH